jgi:hypothetical protein
MLDSNEHYFRSWNHALPQDSHSLQGSTRVLWTAVNSARRTMELLASHILCISLHADVMMQQRNKQNFGLEKRCSGFVQSGGDLGQRIFFFFVRNESYDFQMHSMIQYKTHAHRRVTSGFTIVN